jgi:hypothetical protein
MRGLLLRTSPSQARLGAGRTAPFCRLQPEQAATLGMHEGRGTFQGELLALRWRDVDWLAGRLRVRLVVFDEDARPMLTHESHPRSTAPSGCSGSSRRKTS